jgi:hypothetical protein
MILESVEMPAPENTTTRRAAPSSPAARSSPAAISTLPPSIALRVAAPTGPGRAGTARRSRSAAVGSWRVRDVGAHLTGVAAYTAMLRGGGHPAEA